MIANIWNSLPNSVLTANTTKIDQINFAKTWISYMILMLNCKEPETKVERDV